MTLIIGYAGDDYAILAADRMVTWSESDDLVYDRTDNLTKADFLDGRCLLGFSGDAEINGNTTQWIADVCSDALETGSPPLEALIHRARQYLSSRPRESKSRLGVLAVGYTPVRGHGGRAELLPGLAVLSNGAGSRYGRWNHEEIFGIEFPALPVKAQEFKLWAIGNTPTKSEMTSMAWKIGKSRRDLPDDWRGIATRLAHQIILKSREPESGVGGTVQVAIFPRAAYGDGSMSYSSSPLDLAASPTFAFGVQILANAPDPRPRLNGIYLVQKGFVASQATIIFGGRLANSSFPPPFGAPPRG